MGDPYRDWLSIAHDGASGSADLVAHFFRRAFVLLRWNGIFGFIATNTISQGNTREAGLAAIIAQGGSVHRAVRRLPWPGEAAVVVSVVHVAKGTAAAPVFDGRPVRRISAYLVEGDLDGSPARLAANARKAFQGSIMLSMGFTFDDTVAAKGIASSLEEMKQLMEKEPRNAERISPYIGGEEVNTDPRHAYHRYAINFFDRPLGRRNGLKAWSEMTASEQADCRTHGFVPQDYPSTVAEEWPDLLEIVRRFVKPERDVQKRKALRERWWQYADKRPGLYRAIAPLKRVLACSRIGNAFAFTFLPQGWVYNEKTIVFATDRASTLAALSSRPHELWARFLSSTLKDDLQYTPSDCFENFPFPSGFEAAHELDEAGQACYDHRAALMVARNEGLTKTYNRFHDRSETSEDIQRLRELHAAMDRAVLEAYGWRDLAARAQPIFLDEGSEDDHTYQGRLFWPSDFRDEVLARLLALNAERHAEEVRLGTAPGMKGKQEQDDGDELEEA
jgi:hypothetical protein